MRNAGIDVVQVNSFPLPSFYVLQTLHEHTHTHTKTHAHGENTAQSQLLVYQHF